MALGARRKENHTRAANVARDQIARRRARSGCQSADKVVSALRIYPYVRVGQSDCSCDVRADEVALDCVIRSTAQVNATAVRRNNVTGIHTRAADEVIITAGSNPYVSVSQS